MQDKTLKDLMKLAKLDDNEAYRELFKRFEPSLYKQAYRNGYFDTDCYEECFMAFYFSIEKFKFFE